MSSSDLRAFGRGRAGRWFARTRPRLRWWGKILHLRQHYHFGPEKIAMYLKRYHDVAVSPSGIWRILKRANLNRLPASQSYKRHTERWKRYEKQQPGHAVQIDVKFIEPIKGARRIEQFVDMLSHGETIYPQKESSWICTTWFERRRRLTTSWRRIALP